MFQGVVLLVVLAATSMAELTADSYMEMSGNEIYRERIKQEPTYFVLASKVVRPGQIFRVVVIIYRSTNPMTVRASIHRDGVELASSSQECKLKTPETLLLKIPPTSTVGLYKLRLEGNVNGVLGGTAFANETYLEFSQRSMTIFIQTDKPIYQQGQIVRFRAIPIATNLKAFSDAVDVYMLDPYGTVMKRWLSRQTNLGAVSLEYPLSEQPVYGNWSIRVVAQGQIEDKSFCVEEYYQTPYEVNVTVSPFCLNNDKYIYGRVEANYTSGVAVTGNLTIKIFIVGYGSQKSHFVTEKHYKYFDGVQEFKIPMNELKWKIQYLDKSTVTVEAHVGEHYLNRIEMGFAQTIVFNSDIELKFLGSSPQVFKPAMPFKAYLAVSFHDGSALPSWRLSNRQLEIKTVVTFKNNKIKNLNTHQEQMLPTQPGIWQVNLDLHTQLNGTNLNDVYAVDLEALYQDDSGDAAKANLLIYASYSPTNHRIHVSTSTKYPKVGEYIIFHVRADYYVQKFYYVILSKGMILFAGYEDMISTIKTFAITISAEMSPSATIVVYDIAREGIVVCDSLIFPVDGISRNNFSVTLNEKKDKTLNTVEVIIKGKPGTYIGLSAVDRVLYSMHTGNELTHAQVLGKMNTFDEAMNGTLSHMWHSSIGSPGKIVHFPSSSYGIDTNRTFEFAGLIVFTDANITKRPEYCDQSQGYRTCMDGISCYYLQNQCDGKNDCDDGSDESGCPSQNILDLEKFRLKRFNRIQRLYDSSWLWQDINIGPLGHYIFTVPVPSLSTHWIISAFGMNSVHGFGVLSEIVEISGLRPFYMTVEMPSKSIQGEQIGIRISIFNYMYSECEVVVSLGTSSDYKFIHVEPFGVVHSFSPRTSVGEHQHLVFVKPGKSTVVYMPIVPTRLGDINVTVMAKTQVAKDMITKTIHVEPNGVPQYRHTSFLLDLSQGAYLIKYLDTNLTANPIIPFRQDRLYVFGSNRATVSIVGDVIGPIFPTIPVNATYLLKKPFWCGEQNMFNFAANLYMIRYLRLIGQRKPYIEKKAFHFLNIGYQRQLSYQNDDGSFSLFKWKSKGSVWLTAFCARIFYNAAFQEWENFLYIDPSVITKAISWLIKHQSPDGAFYETTMFPYDRKMNLTSDWKHDNVKLRNISLTAHVLITLTEVKDLGGEIGIKASLARSKAQTYLEKKLSILNNFNDPYELAIVAYALTVSNSIDGEEAFNKLDSRMRETSGLKYWARESILPLKTTIENNRPYILPRVAQKYDASNVETTAYGLLVHVARQAVIQREIVEWLNTQRMSDGGWASTQDTIIATQALIEYSIQSRLRDVTDVTITIEVPSTTGFVKQVHISEDNLAQLQTLEIPNASGSIIIKAQGAGLAIVQLDIQYNVDWPHLLTPPPVSAFLLDVRGHFYGRNNSHINIKSCQSWSNTAESPNSGMAVLEITIPTGYIITQQVLDAYVRSNTVRNLREARTSERKVVFYFHYLDTDPICVSFVIQRWYPVANMTRYLPIKVYEYYAPENYNETMFDAFSLFVLNICQVCGSYQCPYCPVFSWSTKNISNILLQFLCVLLVSSMSYLTTLICTQ